jgi:hypothetical protein
MSWKDTIKPIEATPADSGTPSKSWRDSIAPIPSQDDQPTNLGDLLKGLGQGATLGYGDELLGALQAGKDVATGDKSISDIGSLYRLHQQANQQAFDEAKARSPYLTSGGEIAGSLIPAIATMGGSAEASLGARMLQGAGIGAVAGAGGSHGTIEQDPTDILKDAGGSAVLGAAVPAAFSAIGGAAKGVGNKLIEGTEDNPFLKKLLATYKLSKEQGMNFSGTEAGNDIEQAFGDNTRDISNQFLAPLKKTSSEYGQAIDDATENGATLPLDRDLIAKLKAASDVYKGGAKDPSFMDLLTKHGASSFNPETATQAFQSLNPREAKNLQLALRQLSNSPTYQSVPEISEAANSLTPALDQSLPDGVMKDITSNFVNARKAVEPVINKGQLDPDFQSKNISDINTDDLGSKINSYLSGLIRQSGDGNVQGDKARSAIQSILKGADNFTDTSGKPFINTDGIASTIDDQATKLGIRKAFVGERSSDATLGRIGGPVDWLMAKPYQAAQYLGKVSRAASPSTSVVTSASNPVAATSEAIYGASDDGLRDMASKLNDSGLSHIGAALSQALDNKSEAAKNAALFTIMQNPSARKAIMGNQNGNNSN